MATAWSTLRQQTTMQTTCRCCWAWVTELSRPRLSYVAGDGPWSVTTGDFNGDGVADLATANNYADNLSVLLGVGDGTFAAQTTYAAGDRPRSVTTGDFNGDGVTDLATANGKSNNVSVLLGVGDGNFRTSKPLRLETVPGPSRPATSTATA